MVGWIGIGWPCGRGMFVFPCLRPCLSGDLRRWWARPPAAIVSVDLCRAWVVDDSFGARVVVGPSGRWGCFGPVVGPTGRWGCFGPK